MLCFTCRCTEANEPPQAGVWQSLRCLLYWAQTTGSSGAQQPTACQALEASLQVTNVVELAWHSMCQSACHHTILGVVLLLQAAV